MNWYIFKIGFFFGLGYSIADTFIWHIVDTYKIYAHLPLG